MKYHVWTIGCQMNVSDSLRVASALEQLGYTHTRSADEADVIVLNTCVVRQRAEDKAIGRLSSLKKVKNDNPDVIINLMGCLVGTGDYSHLKQQFPYVDVFSSPSDPAPLIHYLTDNARDMASKHRKSAQKILLEMNRYRLPSEQQGKLVSAFVPIVYGCSHTCNYCIIPLRRGRERSRPPDAIFEEVQSLVDQGVKEVTLLGQIVNRYGIDQPGLPSLTELIKLIHPIEGLERIRFLTSHPNWINSDLLEIVARLPKVMPHFELPVQAGDNGVLNHMRRGYTVEKFMELVLRIRSIFKDVSIITDLIVGFPGESNAQFNNTLKLLDELQPDMTHVARYSPRPGTYAAENLTDSVTPEEKMRRFREVEEMQKMISTEINRRYLGQQVPVLFEDKHKMRWRGRTPTNKLVFVENERNLRGKVLPVEITWTGPWSMIGSLAG